MKHFTRALTLASTLTLAGPAQGQELLRWGFQAGDTWQYRLTQNTSTSSEPLRDLDSGQRAGPSISQSQIRTTTLEAAVQQVDANGNITVDWTYTRVQMSAEGLPGMSFTWDSDSPDPSVEATPLGPMITQLKTMVGRTLTVVMTPRGEILEVRGREAMLAAMLEGLDPVMALMMEEQLGPMFGNDQIVSEFMGGVGMWPEGPASLGESWTTRSEVPLPMFGNITSETRNTVSAFENQSGERVVLILHEGTVVELDNSGSGAGLPMTMTLSDASLSGSTTFSLDRGLILSSTSTNVQVMTMSMPAAGLRQQMRTESSVLLELVGPVTGPRRARLASRPDPDASSVVPFTELFTLDTPNSYVAFSPDGRTLATASAESVNPDNPGELKLWDAATGEERAVLEGHRSGIIGLAFSPDGSTLATGGYDQLVKLWNPATGEEIMTLSGHPSWVSRAVFSPDSKTLATGSGGDPAYQGENEIRLWDVATGDERSTLRFEQFKRNDVYSLAFSPDGTQLASGSAYTAVPPATGTDGRLTLWDLATGEETTLFTDPRGAVLSVAFSPDGKTLAAGLWTRTIRLWDVETGEEIAQLSGHRNWVMGLAFSPDGKRLISGSGNPRAPSEIGELIIWDLETYQALASQSTERRGVRWIALSPDGSKLAVGLINGNVKVWALGL